MALELKLGGLYLDLYDNKVEIVYASQHRFLGLYENGTIVLYSNDGTSILSGQVSLLKEYKEKLAVYVLIGVDRRTGTVWIHKSCNDKTELENHKAKLISKTYDYFIVEHEVEKL